MKKLKTLNAVNYPIQWLYDIITNPQTGKIVATCIHTSDSTDCCGGLSIAQLREEGLVVSLSQIFDSRAAAMEDITKRRAEFDESLD